jgi:DNA-binding SARP family transcriptional activator
LLEITLLSPFALKLTLKQDSLPLKLASRRTEALLIYLVRNPQTHSRDVLANLFWNDLPQNKAMGNLRVLLANLRKELAPYVTINRKTAAINLESDIRLDTARLEKMLATGRNEIDSQGTLTKTTAEKLSDALRTYQGEQR